MNPPIMEDRFKVFDQMVQGVLLVDAHTHQVVRTNEAFTRMVGGAREDFGSLTLEDIVEPADLAGSREAVLQLRAGAVPSLEAAWRYVRTQGPSVSSRTIVVLVHGSPGDGTYFVMVVEDLTQRDALEARILLSSLVNGAIIEGTTHYRTEMEDLVRIRTNDLERARDDAETANRAKSTFLGTVSHELRTPLNAIIGFSSLLLESEGAFDAAEQRKQLSIIRESGHQLLDLIREILDIAAIEAGRLALEITCLDLCRVVDEQVLFARAEAGTRHLELLVTVCDPSIVVRADSRRVGQVIRNLVSNALKFTDHGQVTIDVTTDGVVARIEVEDTGIGISPDRRKELFVPFQRLRQDGESLRPGTGLGLAISRRLVEAMGGQIGATGAPGGGSCFWFTVPLAVPLEPDATLGSAARVVRCPSAIGRSLGKPT
jgi:PAS domain S-box-containing protein